VYCFICAFFFLQAFTTGTKNSFGRIGNIGIDRLPVFIHH
jgi:hypothetical protein